MSPADSWDSARAYEAYAGRWSRKMAVELLRWLAPAPRRSWVDVGCGTGALTSAILAACEPESVRGIDSSAGFVEQARRSIAAPQARFETGDATRLPWETGACDLAVSGLVLNFVSDSAAMAREMARVTKPGGRVAAYVWDYAGGMQMMRHFWDAAIAVSPDDARLDQAERFPLCRPEPLQSLFEQVGLRTVAVRAMEIPTVFISGHGDIPIAVRAMKQGAIEFLTKPVRGQDLLDAVQNAIERDRLLRKEKAEMVSVRRRFELLTPRETEVLNLVVAGLLNKQIADQLGTSELTVKTHRAHVMEKTQADSLANLVRMSEKLKNYLHK